MRSRSCATQYPDLALVVVSALAEGGDRLVAEVALDAGARLVVPLPLPVELYREDFANAQSQHDFAALLVDAETVPLKLVEPDCDVLRTPGPARDRQYLHAGLFVANHCHVLFALWDGREEIGTGGTAQIVRYYLGGPVPGARRATDNLRQMLAGDDDSLVLHFHVRRNGAAAQPPRPHDNPHVRRPRDCTCGGVEAIAAGRRARRADLADQRGPAIVLRRPSAGVRPHLPPHAGLRARSRDAGSGRAAGRERRSRRAHVARSRCARGPFPALHAVGDARDPLPRRRDGPGAVAVFRPAARRT